MDKTNFKISVIIPVFNEQGCIPLLAQKVIGMLQGYPDYEILFVDDGSIDNSLLAIKELRKVNSKIQFLSFSRNFGHQNALRAGINFATGDCVISLDGDFQHPPELIPEMIKKWQEGYDIVYTIRKNDFKISLFKRFTAWLFYKIMNVFSDINIEHGAADFRLIDKKVANGFNEIRENEIFFRGMVKWLGFKQVGIEYVPNERFWGKSKYSLRKMFAFALSGITSFSIKPLRISLFIGILIAVFSFLYGTYALYIKFFTNKYIEGWTSVFFMVTFIGGVQLIVMGIMGEYIGKLFIESKKRPNYIIKENSYELEK